MNNPFHSKPTETAIHQSIAIYRNVIAYRDTRLFTEFFPQGYQHTKLSSVTRNFHDQVMLAKFHLGMLITLLDDFADHPEHLNSILLNEIYKIPFDPHHVNRNILNKDELAILQLAEYLAEQIVENIQFLPHFEKLKNIFKFDLLRFYQANHFSELMSQQRELINTDELLQLRPFNMGMVIAGMIDVIGSQTFDLTELGAARRVFHLGQRFGSICNNINTFTRELEEGDVTNEIIVKGIERHVISFADLKQLNRFQLIIKLTPIVLEMEIEQRNILKKLIKFQTEIHSFSCEQYVFGLNKLQTLHADMEGII